MPLLCNVNLAPHNQGLSLKQNNIHDTP